MPRLALLGALLVVFAAARPALAQSGIEVLVYDAAARAAAAGVPVRLVNDAVGLVRTDTTDAQGKVRFTGLSTAGRYDVSVPEGGRYHPALAPDVPLRANFTQSVYLVVYPVQEVALEAIEVIGTRGYARVNAVDAEVSATLAEAEVELLPVEGRDLARALHRLPNVTLATGFFPEAPTVSINGANPLYASYLIDGMDNNEHFLGGPKFNVPIGIVQDVTVLANTYSTEFGRTGTGVFNVTTKSGGNAHTGEFFYLTRPGSVLDASSPYAQRDLSGNPVKDGFRRQQGGFGVGGPLVRDRTFYFVNVEHTQDVKDNLLAVPALGLRETVTGTNRFTYASAKLDHRWTERLRSTLRGHLGRAAIDRQAGGLEGGVTFPSAANTQDRNAALLALQTTYAGRRLLYEGNLQYSRFRWNYARTDRTDAPQVTALGSEGVPVAVIGHPGFVFDEVENAVQTQQKLTLLRGAHAIKVGADVVVADFGLAGGGNPNGNYTVRLTAAQEAALRARGVGTDLVPEDLPADVEVVGYGVELQPRAFGARQGLWSVYAEDQVALTSRLDVTVGLRYDYDTLSKGGAARGDLDNLAPRLAFNLQLDARSAVRGGYGVFYDKIIYAVYSDALQQNSTAPGFRQQLRALIDRGLLPPDTDLDRVTFDGNLVVNPTGVAYLQGPTPATVQDLRAVTSSAERRILNPEGYDNPRTHQFSLGYQRQLGRAVLFYVDLLHTRAFDLFRLRDLNAPAPYVVTPEAVAAAEDPSTLVRSPEAADAARPVAPVPGGARSIVVSESAGRSRYWAANLNLLKDRAGDRFAYRLSYTLSRLENDTEDINFKARDANDFDAEWGPSINDRTHVVSGVGYLYPARGLGVSVAALVQSGQPINRIPDAAVFGTTDLNGDGRAYGTAYVGNSDRQPGTARNADRLPWAYTVDLGVQYELRVPGGAVELRADVFNVLNTTNLSGYANNATQSNQIQTGPVGSEIVRRNAAPPRQFQFGLRYLY